jgi:hypothetical protein
MSRLNLDLSDTSVHISELQEQYDHYLTVRTAMSLKEMEEAIKDINIILRDLSSIEPRLKGAEREWNLMTLAYTEVLTCK